MTMMEIKKGMSPFLIHETTGPDILPMETIVKSMAILGKTIFFYDEETENFKENFNSMKDRFSVHIYVILEVEESLWGNGTKIHVSSREREVEDG